MRVCGALAAILLLLTALLGEITSQTVKPRRVKEVRNAGRGKVSEIVVMQGPERMKEAILSLVEGAGRGGRDQQVGESESFVVAEDLKDLENVEHALAAIEYEPLKIKRKNKRKIVSTSNEPEVSSSENSNSAVPNSNVFYEVQRTAPPRTPYPTPSSIVIPKYHPKVPQEPRKPLDTETESPLLSRRRIKPQKDVEFVYPVSTRTVKPRFPKLRSQVNPQISSPAEDSKPETAPTPRVPLLFRSHSSFSSETRKPKQYSEEMPSTTVSSRRKKSRKRLVEKATSRENSAQLPPRVHSSVNSEVRNKSRRLISKYDAPRPFSRSQTGKVNLESSLEKLEETGRSPLAGLNRKLYERRDPKTSSSQLEVSKEDATTFDREKEEESSKIDDQGPVSSFKSSEIEGGDVSEAKESEYANSLDAVKVPSSTPLDLEEYKSIKDPVFSVYSTPGSPYSSDIGLHSPLVSTLAPVQSFEVSSQHPWAQESSLKEEEGKSEVSDGVAEASSFGSDEESRAEDGKYEIRGTPEEGHLEVSKHYVSERRGEGFAEENGGNSGGKSDSYGDSSKNSYDSVKESAGGKGSQSGGGKFEKGEGTEREVGHQKTDGDKGEEGYKSWHEHEKANKGHHDKEQRSNYYDEDVGKEKQHKEEGDYHEQREEGEKAAKQAEFGEKGEHQKGYSTKGQHSVHKKDEFEKRTEFFDEFNDEGDFEKDGEFYEEHEFMKGGHEKSSHHDEGDHEEKYGKSSKREKGGHYSDEKGKKSIETKDSHHKHDESHGKKKDHDSGKKWTFQDGDGPENHQKSPK